MMTAVFATQLAPGPSASDNRAAIQKAADEARHADIGPDAEFVIPLAEE